MLRMIRSSRNPKHRALCALTGLMGLRIAEAITVRPDDFDLVEWELRVQGKGDKVRHDIYDVYPADKPSRSYAVKLNGSESVDPHEPGIGETISWWPINRSMFFREVKLKGQVSQRTMYSVSADGKVFTSQSWSPTKPNERGISNRISSVWR